MRSITTVSCLNNFKTSISWIPWCIFPFKLTLYFFCMKQAVLVYHKKITHLLISSNMAVLSLAFFMAMLSTVPWNTRKFLDLTSTPICSSWLAYCWADTTCTNTRHSTPFYTKASGQRSFCFTRFQLLEPTPCSCVSCYCCQFFLIFLSNFSLFENLSSVPLLWGVCVLTSVCVWTHVWKNVSA